MGHDLVRKAFLPFHERDGRMPGRLDRPGERGARHTGNRLLAGCVNIGHEHHIGLIEGYSEEESQALLDDLIAEATRRDRLYIHTWSVGDLLIWDNRCMLHRATPFDDFTKKRDMRCIRTLDMNDG